MTGLARAIRILMLAGESGDHEWEAHARRAYARLRQMYRPSPEVIARAVYRARNRHDSLGGRSFLDWVSGP